MAEPTPQVAAAEAAYESLRELAHTVRDTPSAELYALNRELLGIARLFPDVLRKVSALVLARADEATLDAPARATGRSTKDVIETATGQLLAASELIDASECCLDLASGWLSALAWQPDRDATAPRPAQETPTIGSAATRETLGAPSGVESPSSQRARPISAPGGLQR